MYNHMYEMYTYWEVNWVHTHCNQHMSYGDTSCDRLESEHSSQCWSLVSPIGSHHPWTTPSIKSTPSLVSLAMFISWDCHLQILPHRAPLWHARRLGSRLPPLTQGQVQDTVNPMANIETCLSCLVVLFPLPTTIEQRPSHNK